MKKIVFIGLAIVALSTFSFAEKAEAYCWKWKGSYSGQIYYKCFGPIQLLSAGNKDLNDAVELVGCHGAYWKNSSNELSSYGKTSGAWLICADRKLESYDNSPRKIRNWVNSQ